MSRKSTVVWDQWANGPQPGSSSAPVSRASSASVSPPLRVLHILPGIRGVLRIGIPHLRVRLLIPAPGHPVLHTGRNGEHRPLHR